VENVGGYFSPQPIRVLDNREHRKIVRSGAEPQPKSNLVHFSLTKHFWSSSGGTIDCPPEVLKVAPIEKSNTL